MKHRKKNLTLAKTLSVHNKFNCALQRKSQLIVFCFWQEKPKTVSPWMLIMGAHIASGIDITNSHWEATNVTSKSLGPYQEATKTQQVHLVSKWRKYGTLTSMGKIHHIAKFKTKQQWKTQLQIRKTIIFLDRKYMVKSSHQEWIVTKPVKEKGIQNNYYLTWW